MTYEFYIYRETPTPAVSVGIMLSRSKWESWELFSASGLQRRRNTHIRPLKHSRHSQDGCNLCWLKASHNSSSQAWGQHNWDKHSKNHYHFGEEMCTLTAKIPTNGRTPLGHFEELTIPILRLQKIAPHVGSSLTIHDFLSLHIQISQIDDLGSFFLKRNPLLSTYPKNRQYSYTWRFSCR